MSIESLQEDTQMLRQVLDNLVVFSLSQESNMNHFEGITSNSPKYSKLVKRQHVLREHFNHIDDSLYALSSRNPRVGTTVNDLISDIDDNLEEAILSIADNHASAGSINLHYVINYANDLALMLSEKMNMMNESMKPGKKGKGQKQQGFQLPDIIKKQKSLNEAMKNAMQMGKPQTGNSDKEKSGGQEQSGEQGKEGQQGQEGTQGKSGKSGQSGQQGESGEQGQEGTQGKSGKSGQSGQQGNPDEESDYEKIFEIYKQQQTLRNQLSDKLSKDGMSSDGQRILKEMEQVEDDLLEKGFTQETLNRMMNLKHQLFKLSTAQFQQGEDNKRQSKTAGKQLPSSQVLTPEQIKQYFNTTEILNRQALPLQPKYKEKVKQYFITHD